MFRLNPRLHINSIYYECYAHFHKILFFTLTQNFVQFISLVFPLVLTDHQLFAATSNSFVYCIVGQVYMQLRRPQFT